MLRFFEIPVLAGVLIFQKNILVVRAILKEKERGEVKPMAFSFLRRLFLRGSFLATNSSEEYFFIIPFSFVAAIYWVLNLNNDC